MRYKSSHKSLATIQTLYVLLYANAFIRKNPCRFFVVLRVCTQCSFIKLFDVKCNWNHTGSYKRNGKSNNFLFALLSHPTIVDWTCFCTIIKEVDWVSVGTFLSSCNMELSRKSTHTPVHFSTTFRTRVQLMLLQTNTLGGLSNSLNKHFCSLYLPTFLQFQCENKEYY